MVGGLGCVGKKTTLLQAEASACVSGLANVLFCALAIFIFLFCLLSSKLSAVSLSFTLVHNGLALGAVADFGAQNCQYTTKVDAR